MIRLALLLPLLLAACGNLPQPFFGNPGASATRLAQPPAPRLEVPPPAHSLLSNAAARAWAQVTAAALAEQEVPAVAGPRPRSNEWTLVLAADLRGGQVIPSYTIRNPAGQPQGAAEGAPVAAAEWARATPAMLRAAAAEAAPGIAALLTRIEAARQQSDPKSLLNRPARIYFTGVTGAPGDGDESLAAQMRRKLETQGLVVQDTAKDADYKLDGTVETAPGANGTMRGRDPVDRRQRHGRGRAHRADQRGAADHGQRLLGRCRGGGGVGGGGRGAGRRAQRQRQADTGGGAAVVSFFRNTI